MSVKWVNVLTPVARVHNKTCIYPRFPLKYIFSSITRNTKPIRMKYKQLYLPPFFSFLFFYYLVLGLSKITSQFTYKPVNNRHNPEIKGSNQHFVTRNLIVWNQTTWKFLGQTQPRNSKKKCNPRWFLLKWKFQEKVLPCFVIEFRIRQGKYIALLTKPPP